MYAYYACHTPQRKCDWRFNWTKSTSSVPVAKVLEADKLYGQAPNLESIQAWNSLLPSTYARPEDKEGRL
jgi:hypothetical protein